MPSIQPYLKDIFALLFLVGALFIWQAFRRWTAQPPSETPFDVRDFIMENGKASATKLWLNGAFGATTWGFVYLMLTGKGEVGTILGYGGLWVTPLLARLFKDGMAPTPPVQEVKP